MLSRKPKTELSTTKIIKCKECKKDIRVDKGIKEALCWRCTSKKITEKVEERKVKEKGRKRRTGKKGSRRRTIGKGGDHMSPESIRARFNEAQLNRKLGFFQEVFLLIKNKKKIKLEDLAKSAFKLDSKPDRYDKVDKIQKQLRYYCKSIWGKKSNLVQLTGNTITYKG